MEPTSYNRAHDLIYLAALAMLDHIGDGAITNPKLNQIGRDRLHQILDIFWTDVTTNQKEVAKT